MSDPRRELRMAAEKVGVGEYHTHVLLCTGPTCCTNEAGLAAWETLKSLLKANGPAGCYRSKVGCLRICADGPTMVVYPEGTWYSGMSADRIPRFVQEHLIEGRPIEEWIFARNPLGFAVESQDGDPSAS